MTKLSRRAFVIGLIGGATIAIAAPYAYFQSRRGKPTRIVVAILKRRLGYLNTEPGSFEAFASEYLDYKKAHEQQLRYLSVAALPFTYVTLYRWLPMGHPLRRLEDNVVTKYLLSTDFFLHGADETRPVRYLSFYEAHKAACRNPIARIRYDV